MDQEQRDKLVLGGAMILTALGIAYAVLLSGAFGGVG